MLATCIAVREIDSLRQGHLSRNNNNKQLSLQVCRIRYTLSETVAQTVRDESRLNQTLISGHFHLSILSHNIFITCTYSYLHLQ